MVPFVPSHSVIGCGLSQEHSVALKRHLSSAVGNHQQVGPTCKLSIVNTPSSWGRRASAVQGSVWAAHDSAHDSAHYSACSEIREDMHVGTVGGVQ